jgi:hypothetical protein
MAALLTTIDLLVQYAEFQNPMATTDYATNEFVSAGCPS